MSEFSCIDFSSLIFEDQPFPHFSVTSIFKDNLESKLFDWFEHTNVWSLTIADFYEQYEFSFLEVEIPRHLQCMVSKEIITVIEDKLKAVFNVNSFNLAGITAHKLVDGQRIGIHNDFIGGEETHRLVIQINSGWSEDNGGFLLLFNSSKAEDIAKIVRPLNNSAVGFAISDKSHHAVSTINSFSRYSLIYTFAEK